MKRKYRFAKEQPKFEVVVVPTDEEEYQKFIEDQSFRLIDENDEEYVDGAEALVKDGNRRVPVKFNSNNCICDGAYKERFWDSHHPYCDGYWEEIL